MSIIHHRPCSPSTLHVIYLRDYPSHNPFSFPCSTMGSDKIHTKTESHKCTTVPEWAEEFHQQKVSQHCCGNRSVRCKLNCEYLCLCQRRCTRLVKGWRPAMQPKGFVPTSLSCCCMACVHSTGIRCCCSMACVHSTGIRRKLHHLEGQHLSAHKPSVT